LSAGFDSLSNVIFSIKNSMNMAIKTFYYFPFILFCFFAKNIDAQQLIVVNGGLFGSSTEFANVGIYNSANGSYSNLDTIRTNSVQDVLVEDNRYIYVAAQDSIVKYDLWLGERIAAAGFGSVSTIRLGLYADKLLVGNWYGASEGNLRIFDKNTLSYIDSIPEISMGASDFLVIGNKAYIAQNNVNSSWSDTLGYIAVVDLDSSRFLYNDTLSTLGDEIGRLVNVGDTAIYTLNGVGNTISMLHLSSGNKQTQAAAALLYPKSVGGTIFHDGSNWFLPFNNGIGTYDLVNNTVVNADIVILPSMYNFAFGVDVNAGKIYVSNFDYSNQANNIGMVYNLSGDSTAVFPVGLSPEVLGILKSNVSLGNFANNSVQFDFQLFPNPCSELLNISSSTEIGSVRISDISGRVLLEKQGIENNTFQIGTALLPKGIYLITVGKGTHSFIKN
jgi:hypothetical protein